MPEGVEIVLRVAVVVAAFLVVPLLVGQTEHKAMAHMQSRVGPMYAGGFHGWAQLVADGVKFVQKEDVVPAAADRSVFRLAPAVSLLPYLVVDVPDEALIDLDRLQNTAWSAREQPRGSRRKRVIVRPDGVAAVVRRASA